MTGLLPFEQHRPAVAGSAWVAPGATLVGRVEIADGASVWYGAVIRADLERIVVGAGTNVQDGAVLHADPGLPTLVGAGVSIGHGAVVHGCVVEDDCLIGIRAAVLNGARVGAGSLVAAGAVVLEGTHIPPRSLVAGVPGKVRRQLTEEEYAGLLANARTYRDLAARHARRATP
ncbi:gamma carbonic anhydrase family protein [Actinopolymorpha pittospori]|uniref:Carbonic anhydrase/acetyltransferase-like protein (Isoleucine patch superfamily) n=1 Tax=Actinopolymorpha pittospori TaxID=648752 RepID=A0A927N4Q5_9ACTN|nr:carbonic anhydrase/acetyltransferase-like protein (isoleucine patch superfamily) [Actinopolymorpha pittospori]